MTYPPGGFPPSQFPHRGGFPQPQKKSSAAPVVIIVCVVVVLLCCGGGGVAGLLFYSHSKTKNAAGKLSSMSSSLSAYSGDNAPYSTYSSRHSTPYSTWTTPSSTEPSYAVNDCLYGMPSSVNKGDCTNGGSPYKVVAVHEGGTECMDDQANVTRGGDTYCLAPNFNINYCYVIPSKGWITVAPVCRARGTALVVDSVQGTINKSMCRNQRFNQSYAWKSPPQVVCVNEY